MNFKTYTCKKGRKLFKPIKWPLWNLGYDFSMQIIVRFGAGTDYDLKSDLQSSWNKVGGFSDELFNNENNATMLGWRYNVQTGLHELTQFFNLNDQHSTGSVVTATWNQFVLCHLHKVGELRRVDIQDPVTNIWHGKEILANKAYLARSVQPWFGGKQAAPNKMKLAVECSKL